MFQFTREFIINDNIGHIDDGAGNKVRFLAKGPKNAEDVLIVERMANIRKQDIVSVHKHVHQAEQNEIVKLDLSNITVAKDDLVRLIVTIREEGRVLSLVNDQYPWHSKQYFYEGQVGANGIDDVLEDIQKQADKEAAMEEPDRLISISTASKAITFSANNCYTRFYEIRFVKVPAVVNAANALTGYKDYNELLIVKQKDIADAVGQKALVGAVDGANSKLGNEGCGTVTRIIKNRRLPTDAHLDPFGLQRDELPVPNGAYDQYTIEQVVERRNEGSQVFGSIDHSLTTYVFLVEHNVATAFEAELSKVLPGNVKICPADPTSADAQTPIAAKDAKFEGAPEVLVKQDHVARQK